MKPSFQEADGFPRSDRYILESAPVVALIISREGTILRANRFAELYLGEGLVGSDLDSYLYGTTFAEITAQGFGERNINVNDYTGAPRTLRIAVYEVPGDAQTHYAVFGHHDVEEMIELDDKLHRANTDLNIMNREVQRKNKELERLTEMKNRFLGMASHDLRKFAAVIISASQLIREFSETELSEENQEYLDVISSTAHTMINVLKNFLDYSVLETGKLLIAREPVPSEGFFERIAGMNRFLIGNRKVTIDLEIGPMPEYLWLDPSRIEQVCMNLLSNAVDYAPEGSAVRFAARVEEGPLIITVRDEGPGIPEDLHDAVFEPYRQGEIKKRTGKSGTGLGLTIARAIAELHGGELDFESTPGEGTEFRCTIPEAAGQEDSR
jgi:signal transduction histidine kinase